jgi:diguanylate cyclase (GGDEF)-like protein/PAS domain S-box-containing protein
MDIRTLAIVLALLNALYAVALALHWRLSPARTGQGWWPIGTVLFALGFACTAMRDAPPPWGQTAALANYLLPVAGLALLYTGLVRFLGLRQRLAWLAAAVLAYTAGQFLATFLSDDITVRRLLLELAIGGLCLATAARLLPQAKGGMRLAVLFPVLVFGIAGLGYTALAAVLPFQPAYGHFDQAPLQAVQFLLAFATSALWPLAFIIMGHQRLNLDAREAANNLRTIFTTSPDAVMITRLSDGLVMETNAGLCQLTGWRHDEVVGRTLLELGVWLMPEQHAVFVDRLQAQGQVENMEVKLADRSGDAHIGLLSAQSISVHGVPHAVSVIRDITRRKRMENHLLANEQFLNSLIEDNGALICAKDAEGRYLLVNRTWESATGLGRAATLGRTDEELFPGDTGTNFRTFDLAVLEQGTVMEKEETLATASGYRHLLSVKFPLRGPDGEILGICGLSTDITERKRAETALHASEALHRSILQATPDNLTVTGLDLIIRQASPAALRMFGLPPDSTIVGRRLLDFLAPDERERAASNLALLRRGIPTGPAEYRVQRADGGTIVVEANAELILGPDEAPSGLVFAIRDITVRKQMEDEIRHYNVLVSQLLQTTDQGIYGIDPEGCCTFINNSGLRMLGYELDECLGRDMHVLIHHSHPDGSPYPTEECPIYRACSADIGCRYDTEFFWRRDGSAFPVEYSSFPIRENGCTEGAVVTFSDITQRKRYEERIQELLRQREAERDSAMENALTDSLTGLANRRFLDQSIAQEFNRQQRTEASLAAVMIDVDHFKAYNDHHGHQAGDECLRQVALAIQTALARKSDIVARYGGEEFLILLPDTDAAGAIQVAERVRSAVEALELPHGHSDASERVTVSLGVASRPATGLDAPTSLVALADGALYRAKQSGRNRCVVAD